MPSWVTAGVDEYVRRLPREFSVTWQEVPPAKRQGDSAETFMAKEAQFISRQLKTDERIVALDVTGSVVSTEDMAAQISEWQMTGQSVSILIGGPDGLDPSLLKRASAKWSFGRITLPHPLVRVVLAEQLYRAWSINNNHPYHRA
tara:strand:+ start:128 stop:562 length:435 start_codon:yes stop_codon:yes gene_type:complete